MSYWEVTHDRNDTDDSDPWVLRQPLCSEQQVCDLQGLR